MSRLTKVVARVAASADLRHTLPTLLTLAPLRRRSTAAATQLKTILDEQLEGIRGEPSNCKE